MVMSHEEYLRRKAVDKAVEEAERAAEANEATRLVDLDMARLEDRLRDVTAERDRLAEELAEATGLLAATKSGRKWNKLEAAERAEEEAHG